MAGFSVWRNGTPVDVAWSRSQLLSISLGMAAYDGQVGTGSVTLPGAPITPPGAPDATGWQIGDRISFVDDDAGVLYTGYLLQPKISRNPDASTEIQADWSLMDVNRLFIGRRVTDETQGYFWLAGVSNFFDTSPGTGAPTVDVTTAVNTDLYDDFPTDPVIVYNSDGATDWIGDVVKRSGYTVYLALTGTENSLELHVHELGAVNPAGFSISDDPAEIDEVDVFAAGGQVRTLDTASLMDGITGRNGVETDVHANTDSLNQGGINFETFVDYQVSFAELQAIVTNTVIPFSTVAKYTLGFTVYNLTGTLVASTRPGSLITIDSEVLRPIAIGDEAIRHETLTVSRDEAGNPRPGFWDMAIECGFPYRGAQALVLGLGLQDSPLGAFSSYRQWVRTEVEEDNPAILVGEFETVRGQLLDKDDIATPIANVGITFTVVSNDYDDPHPDYSVFPPGSFTDQSGAAYTTVEHFQDTMPDLKHRVKAEAS